MKGTLDHWKRRFLGYATAERRDDTRNQIIAVRNQIHEIKMEKLKVEIENVKIKRIQKLEKG